VQLQLIRHEREVMQVAGAKNDGVHIGGRTVFEGAGIRLDILQQRHFFDVVGPLVACRSTCWPGVVRDGDRLAAVLPALRGDVLG